MYCSAMEQDRVVPVGVRNGSLVLVSTRRKLKESQRLEKKVKQRGETVTVEVLLQTDPTSTRIKPSRKMFSNVRRKVQRQGPSHLHL